MSQSMKLSRLRFRPRFNLLTALLFGLAAALGSPLAAQTTIGYVPNADLGSVNSPTIIMSSSNGYVVAFDFTNATIGGDYTLSSISLLLSGNANLADFSARISTTAPTAPDNITPLPTALTTLSASSSGTLNASTASAYTFTPNSSYTLSADTTYYLTILYNGSGTANWIATTSAGGDTGSGTNNYGTALSPLTSALNPATNGIFYRSVHPVDGYGSYYSQSSAGSNLGLAITAVPEPGTTTALFGAAALLAGLFIRRRRSARATFRG